MPSHTISLRSTLILFSHLCLGLDIICFPQVSDTKTLYSPLPLLPTFPDHLFCLYVIILILLERNTNHEAFKFVIFFSSLPQTFLLIKFRVNFVTSHFLENSIEYIHPHRKTFDKIFTFSGKLIFLLCDKVLSLLVRAKSLQAFKTFTKLQVLFRFTLSLTRRTVRL